MDQRAIFSALKSMPTTEIEPTPGAKASQAIATVNSVDESAASSGGFSGVADNALSVPPPLTIARMTSTDPAMQQYFHASEQLSKGSWISRIKQNHQFTIRQADFNKQLVELSDDLHKRITDIETGSTKVMGAAAPRAEDDAGSDAESSSGDEFAVD